MNKNQKTLLWIAGSVVLVALGGILSNGDDTATDTPAKAKPAVEVSASPKAKPSTKPKPSTTPTVVAPVKFDEPNAAEQKALLSKLRAINPGITVNEERAVRRAVNTCQGIQAGNPEKTEIKEVSMRFTGGNVTVDAGQAAEIIEAVKDTFCD